MAKSFGDPGALPPPARGRIGAGVGNAEFDSQPNAPRGEAVDLPLSAEGLHLRRRALARPLTTVFLLALAVRLINLALLTNNNAFFAEADTFGYWALGAALANGGTFSSTLWSMTDRMPLYPLLLAGVHAALGDAPRTVALIQAMIDAGTCTLIAALGAFVSPLVGLIAGVLAALSMTLIVFSTQILTDTLFLFFFTLMLLAGACFMRRPTIGTVVLAGLAGGLSLAIRPASALLLVAAVPLVFLVAVVNRRSVAVALAAATLFAVAAAAPVAPVLLRNVIHYGSFKLTSQTGKHLAYWIVPLVIEGADGPPYRTSVARIEALVALRLAERGLGPDANPFRVAAVQTEIARELLARLPAVAFAKAWLGGMAVNLAAPALLADPRARALPKSSFYETPGANLWEKARAYVFDDPGLYQAMLLLGLIAMIPMLALEVIGFVVLARMLPWAAVFGGGVLAYFLLINGPVATAKYRLPMEPILIVFMAVALAPLAERRKM